MKKVLLATVAVLAFSASSFAAEPAKTVGQAPPSTASSFYLAQDTATMKCQIVETQPAAGSSVKVVGAPHPTKASAETALKADKACAQWSDGPSLLGTKVAPRKLVTNYRMHGAPQASDYGGLSLYPRAEAVSFWQKSVSGSYWEAASAQTSPREVAMPDYLYDENIAHFERLVADSVANSSRDEKRHAMLLRLLAEEKAKRSTPQWSYCGGSIRPGVVSLLQIGLEGKKRQHPAMLWWPVLSTLLHGGLRQIESDIGSQGFIRDDPFISPRRHQRDLAGHINHTNIFLIYKYPIQRD
jgi:hypothetical protein